MRAITLHRPWDQAILHGGKDYENRTWSIPDRRLGEPIALHAGKTYDVAGAGFMLQAELYTPPPPEECPTGIVGIVWFDFVLEWPPHAATIVSPWFAGPFGWHISTVLPFDEPIPCGGRQGLWDVPHKIWPEIRRLWLRALADWSAPLFAR